MPLNLAILSVFPKRSPTQILVNLECKKIRYRLAESNLIPQTIDMHFHPKLRREPHYSSASSTLAVKSRFTAPEVSGAGVAVVVADGVVSVAAAGSALESSAVTFLDFFFFFLVCNRN